MAYNINTDTTLDLWQTTLAAYEFKNKYIDYLLPYQKFCVVDEIWQKDRMQIGGGTEFAVQVNLVENGGTQYITPGQVRSANIVDGVATVKVPYFTVTNSYIMLDAEITRNTGMAALKSLLENRRNQCWVDMAVSLDTTFWALPSTSNNLYPAGAPYWLVPITIAQKATSTASGAHQGGNPTGFASTGGIDASAYSRWQSYNAALSNNTGDLNEADLLAMGKMFRHLDFQAPVIASDLREPKFKKFRIFTTEANVDAYSAAMRKNKDSLARDPSEGYGAGIEGARSNEAYPMFKGLPVQWAKPLDSVSGQDMCGTNPLYFINTDEFYAVYENGMYFKERPAMRFSSAQPDAIINWIDLSGQYVCRNRRQAGGVISYPVA